MKPISIQSATRFSWGVLSLGILVACGGGGGGLDIADGGIRGTGSSVGPVSGFGSVFVNGVRFDTSSLNGQVQSDDGITTETGLDEGMILRVDGEWQANGLGTASRLDYDDTLRGPISVVSAWDSVSQVARVSIQGLVVNIDQQTVIKGVALPDDLADNDVVRVSGWRLPDGEFRASLIRVQTGNAFDLDNEVELEGRVTNFNSSPCSFEIGTVLVFCNDPNVQFETVTPADLSDEPFIEVEGNLLNGDLHATEIRPDDVRQYRRGIDQDIELSGPVTGNFDGNTSSFVVNGIVVTVTSDTEFDDGLTAQDLVSGLLIQLEGDYQDNGTITAEEIDLREGDAEVEGVIQGEVDRAAGTFTVSGVLVQLTSLTLIENDEDDSELTIEELINRLGDGVEVAVKGIERQGNGGVFIEALKIKIED